MRNFLIAWILIISFKTFIAQKADSAFFYLNKYDLKKSITFYKKKLKTFRYTDSVVKNIDLYNLACAYSLAGNTKEPYRYLRQSIKCDPTDYTKYFFLTDPDFYNQLNDSAWWEFVKEYAKCEKELPDSLLYALSQISIRDQALYKKLYYSEQKYGLRSKQVKQIWDIKDSLNKVNLESVEALLEDSINVLSTKTVGPFFASKCFLVIQHSDTATMAKYLPVIKRLYELGETRGENYALLYDRIHVYRYKGVQYYGTQVNTDVKAPYPIKNEINVDKRRKELGMEPLKDYLLKFGIFYKSKR